MPDVSDEELSLTVPYLTLMTDAPQCGHSLRELFNALRYVIRYGITWRAMPNDPPPWAERKRGSKAQPAIDTLGHLLALYVTSADVGDRTAVKRLAADIQDATGDGVRLAYVDQGYSDQTP